MSSIATIRAADYELIFSEYNSSGGKQRTLSAIKLLTGETISIEQLRKVSGTGDGTMRVRINKGLCYADLIKSRTSPTPDLSDELFEAFNEAVAEVLEDLGEGELGYYRSSARFKNRNIIMITVGDITVPGKVYSRRIGVVFSTLEYRITTKMPLDVLFSTKRLDRYRDKKSSSKKPAKPVAAQPVEPLTSDPFDAAAEIIDSIRFEEAILCGKSSMWSCPVVDEDDSREMPPQYVQKNGLWVVDVNASRSVPSEVAA